MRECVGLYMKINLREIIDIPGSSLPFECELEFDNLDFLSIARYNSLTRAAGRIVNIAGALELQGELFYDAAMICDRCLEEYDVKKKVELNIHLAKELQDEDNANIFLLDGDFLDLGEVLETCFILEMETKSLCSEECAGICPDCGANLNFASCSCKPQTNPRMAVLEQLLDID